MTGPTMAEPAIQAVGVSKFYGDYPALRDVDLEARGGRVLALLGRNGAGKTTMLRILAGLTAPTRGEVRLPAADAAGGRRGSHVGVVGHGGWIYDELTAEENLRFFGRLYGAADPQGTAERWLARVGLERFRRSRAAGFSRGMRQRLTIARAFLHEPGVLLLDEPWTALDDRASRLLSDLVAESRERGRAVVICSHQLREAVESADDVAVLDRGRVAYRDRVDEALRDDPASLYERLA